MKAASLSSKLWIQSAGADLAFFSFGWLLVFAVFCAMHLTGTVEKGQGLLVLFILLFNFLHRHLTFPLVYGDPEQFRRRRKSYLGLPIFFLVLTALCLSVISPARLETDPIPARLSLPTGSHLNVVLVGSGKSDKTRVIFSGKETDLGQMAATYRAALRGKLEVVEANDRLIFQLPSDSAYNSFHFSGVSTKKPWLASLGLQSQMGKAARDKRPYFMALVVVSVLWTMYHTIMQKVGLMRVYSRKASWGEAWLDKAAIFSWVVYLFFQLTAMGAVRERAHSLAMTGRLLNSALQPVLSWLPIFAVLALAVALAITALYFKKEWANPGGFNWPKNLFFLSILGLYGVFFYDLLVGYAVMGFSHAIEYLAFVNIFSRKKFIAKPERSSLLARAVRHQALSFGLFAGTLFAAFFIWRGFSNVTLQWYIIGSSFLHFIYDGWIWKVRQPEVGQPLGLSYGVSTGAPMVTNG